MNGREYPFYIFRTDTVPWSSMFFFRKDGKSFGEFLLEGEKDFYNKKTPNSHHITPPLETDATRKKQTHHAPLGEKQQKLMKKKTTRRLG